jgi:hypothetical protein
MKLVGAAVFVVSGIAGLVVVLDTVNALGWLPVWVVGGFLAVSLLGLAVMAIWLFGTRLPQAAGVTAEEAIRQLDAQGLLDTREFRATRAFAVDEFEDEGLHYYVELTDKRVLFLSGQYLYEYEPDPKSDRPRSFPCTEFAIRRHKREGYAVSIDCRGQILEPEVVTPPFRTMDWEDEIPRDGDLIEETPYDRLKDARLDGGRSR